MAMNACSQMCLAGLFKGYPQQADLLQLALVDDERTSPAAHHTSGDGDPDTEQPLRVMVLQSTAPCCTPSWGESKLAAAKYLLY